MYGLPFFPAKGVLCKSKIALVVEMGGFQKRSIYFFIFTGTSFDSQGLRI
jgi:hypothetical protein